MPRALFGILLFFGIACKNHQYVDSTSVPTGVSTVNGTVADGQPEVSSSSTCQLIDHRRGQVCQQPCPQKDTCPAPKQPEKLGAPAPTEAPPSNQQQAVITQDIMLIPRMVYVPYAPQVPVTPARLGTVLPAGTATTQNQEKPTVGEAPPPVCAPPQNQQVCDALEKCCQQLQCLSRRLEAIEAQTQSMTCPNLPGPRCRPVLVRPVFPLTVNPSDCNP